MNVEHLLAHFERMSEAPDAIARLRRFILDLAVRGKLVEQDPEDEPVESYLKLIKAQPIDQGDFGTPCHWAWVSVGEVCSSRLGKMLDKAKNKGTERPYLRNINVRWLDFDLSDLLEMRFEESELSEYELKKGDVLICEGGEPGRAAVWDDRARGVYFQKAIHRVRFDECVDPFFFVYVLRCSALDERLSKYFTGTGISHFTGKSLKGYLFPLPPLAEQHRIVAKVDELMVLCDQLEAARQQRQQGRKRLVAATLQLLNQPAEDPTSFRKDASFALQVLPSLTTTPAQIKQLRQTILNLAVRGKLVEQDPEDEPVLSSGIFLKLQGQSPKRSKRGRTSSTASLDMERYQQVLPAGWASLRLADLVAQDRPISYGVLVPGDDVPKGVPFVRAQDLALDGHPSQPGKSISPDVERAYSRTRLLGGEILICVVGSIGKLGIAPAEWAGANIARAVARIAPISDSMKGYLLLVLRSSLAQSFFFEATRTLAQPTLNIGLLEEIPIPLPPLAEQHRIVAMVDKLMALCDQLEQQLSQADQQRRRLLEAVLAEALLEPEKTLEAVYA